MTEEKKEMTNEEPVIITIDDTPYRASDLNDEQITLANELQVIARDMQQLEAQFNKLNRDKTYRVSDFQRSLEVETPEDSDS